MLLQQKVFSNSLVQEIVFISITVWKTEVIFCIAYLHSGLHIYTVNCCSNNSWYVMSMFFYSDNWDFTFTQLFYILSVVPLNKWNIWFIIHFLAIPTKHVVWSHFKTKQININTDCSTWIPRCIIAIVATAAGPVDRQSDGALPEIT